MGSKLSCGVASLLLTVTVGSVAVPAFRFVGRTCKPDLVFQRRACPSGAYENAAAAGLRLDHLLMKLVERVLAKYASLNYLPAPNNPQLVFTLPLLHASFHSLLAFWARAGLREFDYCPRGRR